MTELKAILKQHGVTIESSQWNRITRTGVIVATYKGRQLSISYHPADDDLVCYSDGVRSYAETLEDLEDVLKDLDSVDAMF